MFNEVKQLGEMCSPYKDYKKVKVKNIYNDGLPDLKRMNTSMGWPITLSTDERMSKRERVMDLAGTEMFAVSPRSFYNYVL